ncbi:hypothetical protein BC939DRAFT_448528 [Gamsiella multidivaricata]|uniref:uncharacterized protein n=1 Tax=Gamsiella multidivaricata TaxID=101098 RepID=UPI00221ED500|nr:uncharacterized protein BC939DRAFT_448528 [Gamsiella multidivaricata]KAG0360817.1 hypothetical protein BGZ54_009379 [Gamsiella multidivaricata]KAI7825324.1 hypothetical protein BC939DRAFT_448528 [Gamsiella multidivaricata]
MTFTFDIELDTEQPFVVVLDQDPYRTQVLQGAIVLQMTEPEKFKVATIAIHGHIGVALNIDTKPTVVHERLIESSVDLVAANDTEGQGTISISGSGTQYIPFRIDVPRSHELPPTLLNKLDTHYIDWKYEIHATLQRDSIFASTKTVKHDLIFRRPIAPLGETTATLTASTDMPGQFRSKLTAPSRTALGEDKLAVTVEMKARHKSYMVKEIDCAVVQTEDISYYTRRGHPKVENAHVPGVPCKVSASRLVSAFKKIPNDDNDLDFGRHKPIVIDLRLDNNQLIPTERGFDWLEISHVLRYTVHFMDVNLQPIVTELPLFVGHEGDIPVEEVVEVKGTGSERKHGVARLMESLKTGGTDNNTTLMAA